MSETIRILKAGQEIGRVTAEKLEFAKKYKERGDSLTIDDPKLFTAKDASGKALFVVRVSEDKEIMTERI